MATWVFQDVVTVAAVLAAGAFLARRFVPGLAPKRAGVGCAHCPSKDTGGGSCCDTPVVVTLSAPALNGRKASGKP